MNNGAFKAVTKGGGIGFLGMASSALLQFIIGIVIIRLLTKSEFGLISLGNVIINVLATISTLGLTNGVPRFLAKYPSNNGTDFFHDICGAALSISITVSVVIALLAYTGASTLATVLSKPELVDIIRIFALVIPFQVLTSILTAIFRGLRQAKPKLMFEDIVGNSLRLALVISVALIGNHFLGIAFAYVGSAAIAAILYFIYAERQFGITFSFHLKKPVTKELFYFSGSLLGLSIILLLMDQMAALILGYLQPSEQVARFNAPLRLAQLLQIPLQVMSFLYLPYATGLYESGKKKELQELYLRVTKWTCFISTPIFLTLFLDAKFIVVYLFGTKYIDSAPILQILALGFFINTVVGLNGQTLLSIGKSREILVATTISLLVNMALGMLLVPNLGAFGSSIAVASGLFILNVLMSADLAMRHKIYPMSIPYIKSIVLTIFFSISIYFIYYHFNKTTNNIFIHILISVMFVFISISSQYLARNIDYNDLDFFYSIRDKLFGNK